MDTISPIFASAQQLMQRGFSRLDRAAGEIVAATTGSDSAAASPGEGMRDSFLQGVFDTFQARQEIRSGIVLTHVYSEMSAELKRLGEGHVDTYA